MKIRYLGIFILGFLLFSCGTPPAGWEGGSGGNGNGDGNGNGNGNGVVYGCTDPEALNYNSEATEDDGSCDYYDPCENLYFAYTDAYDWYINSYEYDYYNPGSGYDYELCLAMDAAYLAALYAGCDGFTESGYNEIYCY
jgi:hypothetical protein